MLRAAVRAANLIGDGLYGVDIKQVGRRALVIEVNDNPSLDSGYEDRVLGDALYARVAEFFRARVEAKRAIRPWTYHLFEAYGIELEYMLVEPRSLEIRPVADQVLQALAGEPAAEVEIDGVRLFQRTRTPCGGSEAS